MDYIAKMVRKLSIKSIAIHIVGLVVSMSIIWGISYLILVTFSIQDSETAIKLAEPIQVKNVVSTSTSSLKKSTSTTATTTATTSKHKK